VQRNKARSRGPAERAQNARNVDEAQPPYEAKTRRGDYFRERLLFRDGISPSPSIKSGTANLGEISAALFFTAELGTKSGARLLRVSEQVEFCQF
jgi:hypothetical protein